MRHRVAALCENVRTDSRLIVEQGTFVRVRGRRIHTRTEVHEDTVVAVPALHHDGSRIRAEARGVHEIFGGENADLGRPLERRECLIERQADRVVVGDETRCFTGALEEVRKRVGAVLKGPHDAGRCGNGHPEIITGPEFNC